MSEKVTKLYKETLNNAKRSNKTRNFLLILREMPIAKDERAKILAKFAESLQQLEPTELPPLANQLFSLTTNIQLVLMVLFSFQKYFHKYYYKKLFSDMETDSMTESDSIGKSSNF